MERVKVLFFSADPLSISPGGGPRLHLDEEVRQIQQRVRAAEHRDQLDFEFHLVTRFQDLRRALLVACPQVVHFSGYGSKDGLILLDSDEVARSVSAAEFADLFQLFRDSIRLVVLNASYSMAQARAIAEVVGCAIGMADPISDSGAITFGAALYQAIASGQRIPTAFDFARTILSLEYPAEVNCPQLAIRSGLKRAQLSLLSLPGGAGRDVQPVRPRKSTSPVRSTIFISYSHKDRKWLERLQVHLKPLERKGLIAAWADTKIKPGTDWRAEIELALDSARVAILLISADFMASDYIATNELPPLLEAAGAAGATIFPLILSSCRFAREPNLAKFQAVNDPARPVDSLTRAKQEAVFDRLSEAIEQVLQLDT